MVINPIVGVYIPIIGIPYSRLDDHSQYSDFWPWHICVFQRNSNMKTWDDGRECQPALTLWCARLYCRSQNMKFNVIYQGCRFVPYGFSETKPRMVPTDLNIGFQGLALIQGQIFNPVYVMGHGWCFVDSLLPILVRFATDIGQVCVMKIKGWFDNCWDHICYLGGDFKYCLFSPLLGEDSHFDSYFSDGLKPPTR